MRKSLKSKLVKTVTKDFCQRCLFDFTDEENFQKELQIELNNHLNFKTDVCMVKYVSKMNFLSGQVLFEDEELDERSVDFTIMPRAIINDTKNYCGVD
jgi:hypothetical protein